MGRAYLEEDLRVERHDGGRVGGRHRRELVAEVTQIELTLDARHERRSDLLVRHVVPVNVLSSNGAVTGTGHRSGTWPTLDSVLSSNGAVTGTGHRSGTWPTLDHPEQQGAVTGTGHRSGTWPTLDRPEQQRGGNWHGSQVRHLTYIRPYPEQQRGGNWHGSQVRHLTYIRPCPEWTRNRVARRYGLLLGRLHRQFMYGFRMLATSWHFMCIGNI